MFVMIAISEWQNENVPLLPKKKNGKKKKKKKNKLSQDHAT